MSRPRRLPRTVVFNRRSKRLIGDFLVALVSSVADAGTPYFSVQVPKRLMPRAVDRNRFKRLCRAVIYDMDLPNGTIVILQPRGKVSDVTVADIRQDFNRLMTRV